MKIGKILREIPGTIVTIAAIGVIAYTTVALSTTAIQNNFFHDFRGTVQVRGIELYYEGVEPYNPRIPFPWQDRNGSAEVRLKGNKRVFLRYDDLTAPSLEGRIWVTDSKGEGAEFYEKTKYDRKTLKDASELKNALESVGSDKSIRDIVEQEIKEAIAKK